MRIAFKALAVLVAIVVIGAMALAVVGIPASVTNATLSERIARESGAKVTFGGATRIGLFPLRLTVNDVSVIPAGDVQLRVTIAQTEIALKPASVFAGAPAASTVTLTRPVLSAPLLRERVRTASPAPAPSNPPRIPLDTLAIRDAAVVLSDPSAKVEQRIDGVTADVTFAADRGVAVTGRASLGGKPASFSATTRIPSATDRPTSPFTLTLDAPGVLARVLSATGDVKIAGALVSLSNLTGTFGSEPFNGWASADLSSKPVLKLDLDFPRLSFDAPRWRDANRESGWSSAPFDLADLNYVDAQARLSTADLTIGTLRIAPAAFDITLGSGALKAQAARLAVGGGEIDGDLVIDASTAVPDVSLRADLTDVRAGPLLASLAGFERLDGKLSAKLMLRGAGANPKALAGAVSGTASLTVRDGEIVGINVAQMIRMLTGTTLDGWQADAAQTTDLSQLSASFRFDRGQGSTADLMLSGPLVRLTGAGNIDLVSETMAFRVDPKLVMSLQGQSAPGASPAPTPIGLGVPVIVQGPWASPRIYPELSGMLDNPEAAYAQLRQMGQGLFGRDVLGKDLQGLLGQSGQGGSDGGDLGRAIGNIIQGLGAGRSPPSAPSPSEPATPPVNDIMKRLFGR